MKDIIFANRPPITSFKGRVQAHINLNNKLEEMKNSIRNTPTLKSAVDVLIEKFGREELLYIVQAIREVFEVGNEQIGKYL